MRSQGDLCPSKKAGLYHTSICNINWNNDEDMTIIAKIINKTENLKTHIRRSDSRPIPKGFSEPKKRAVKYEAAK